MSFFASQGWWEIGLSVCSWAYLPYLEQFANLSAVLYAVKSFLQVTIYALEVILPNETRTQTRKREGSLSFRSFGDVRKPSMPALASLVETSPPIAIHSTERRV